MSSVANNFSNVFSTFDTIKELLNKLMINGMGKYKGNKRQKLTELGQKLDRMGLSLISNILYSFLEANKNQNMPKMVESALKLFSSIRMFESVINREMIKTSLISWMEPQNAKNSK